MEDLLKAFVDFLTDLFAALADFLGGKFALGDIIGDVGGLLGGEETTAPAGE